LIITNSSGPVIFVPHNRDLLQPDKFVFINDQFARYNRVSLYLLLNPLTLCHSVRLNLY